MSYIDQRCPTCGTAHVSHHRMDPPGLICENGSCPKYGEPVPYDGTPRSEKRNLEARDVYGRRIVPPQGHRPPRPPDPRGYYGDEQAPKKDSDD